MKKKIDLVYKYCPKKLEDIISQKKVTNTLKLLIESRRFPHLLFCGRSGTGKTATILACARKIYGDNYENYILELNSSDDRGINIVREDIKSFAENNSLFGTQIKLIILDEAESMTVDAQFALRRIMEKYISNVRFCLICNYPNKIIPAIKARCMNFHFRLISNIEIYKKLIDVCSRENIKYEKDGLKTIVKISNGDMRICYNTLQSINATFGFVDKKNALRFSGFVDVPQINNILDIISKKNCNQVYKEFTQFIEKNSLSLFDIINAITNFMDKWEISDNKKLFIIIELAKLQKYLVKTNKDQIFIFSFIGILKSDIK